MTDSLCKSLPCFCFDAVGTLIFPAQPVAQTYADAGRRCGFEVPLDIIEQRFREAWEREESRDRQGDLRTSEERERARWQAIIAHVFHDQPQPLAPFADLWRYYARSEAWTCYPDAARLIQRLLDVGGRFAIASNFDTRLRSIVRHLHPLHQAAELVISSEVGWRKPARQFFETLLDRLRQKPDRVIYVGDSWTNDFEPAARLGLEAYWLRRSEPPKADRQLQSLEPLAACLHPGREKESHGCR